MAIKISKNKKGFTMIELIVSVSIMVFMFTLFLANYHSANKRSALVGTVHESAGSLRLAQSYALGSKEFGTEIPQGGWGINFSLSDPTKFIIFADLDPDPEDEMINSNFQYDLGEEFKTVDLPAGISLNSISAGNSVDIIFQPPNPVVYINGLMNDRVEVEFTDGETTKKITVNFLGLVDIED